MFKFLLYPFMLIYGVITSIRNFLYDSKIWKQNEFKIPIISVGNLTAGGTGKTPHAEYLISLLKTKFNIAFLSRGYKRKTKGYVLAAKQSNLRDIGDEPVQIKQKFPEIPVAVCENRVVGIKKLLADKKLDIDAIILDDAFQHRSVKPNINILLLDYTQSVFDDKLLPVGRLRESTNAIYRANFIIFTKCPSKLQPIEQRIIKNKLNIRPYQDLFFTSIVYGEITPAEKGLNLFCNDMLKYSVLLITGIGNPDPLVDYLRFQVGNIVHLKFADHFEFKEADILNIEAKFNEITSPEKMMITTEKDLIRIKSLTNLPKGFINNLYYIPIEIKFLDKTKDSFNKRILNYVTENKSNSKFH